MLLSALNWEHVTIYLAIHFIILLLFLLVLLYLLIRYQASLREKILLQAGEIARSNPYTMLDGLLDEYYACKGSEQEQEKMFRHISKLINRYKSDPEELNLITAELGGRADGLPGCIREVLPNIKDRDYRMLIYMISGLSNRTACVLLDEGLDNYYRRKSRLKNKLQQSTHPEAKRLLAYF